MPALIGGFLRRGRVYSDILILPDFGIISHIINSASNKPIFGYLD